MLRKCRYFYLVGGCLLHFAAEHCDTAGVICVIGRQIKSAETQEHFFPLAVLDRMVASLHFSLFGARASGGKSMAVFLKPLDSIRQELPVCDVLLPPDLYGSITDEGSSSPHHSQSGWRVKKRDEREQAKKSQRVSFIFHFIFGPYSRRAYCHRLVLLDRWSSSHLEQNEKNGRKIKKEGKIRQQNIIQLAKGRSGRAYHSPPPLPLFFDCIGPDHRETSHDFVLEPPTSSEYVCNMFTPTTSCPPHWQHPRPK